MAEILPNYAVLDTGNNESDNHKNLIWCSLLTEIIIICVPSKFYGGQGGVTVKDV